jgi:hypothetical protein
MVIASFRSLTIIHPFVLIAIGSMVAAGLLMSKGKWWGCFGGIAVGIFLIYMGLQETGQIIKEWPLGMLLCAYYIVCGIYILMRKTTKKTAKKTELHSNY